MTTGFLLGIFVPWAIGALALRFVWPVAQATACLHALRGAIAFFLGAGIVSLLTCFALVVFRGLDGRLPLLELGTLAVLAIASWLRPATSEGDSSRSDIVTLSVGALGVAIAAFAILVLQARTRAFPHGDLEAWTIWNAHARSLYFGGEDWRSGFLEVAGLGHPQAPLLVSAMVSQLWCWIGEADARASATLAMLATMATAVAVFGAAGTLRGPLVGWIAGIAWFGSGTVVSHMAAQGADIPSSALGLGAVVCLVLARLRPEQESLTALAGLLAAAVAWTKPEGLVLLVVTTLVALCSSWRHVVAFLFGTIPFGVALAWFALTVAPPGGLVSTLRELPWAERCNDVERLQSTAERFLDELARSGSPESHGGWQGLGALPILALAAAIGFWFTRRGEGRQAVLPLAVFGLALGVHFVLHMVLRSVLPSVLPAELAWSRHMSVEGTMLQLWPIAILGLCLCLPGTRTFPHPKRG